MSIKDLFNSKGSPKIQKSVTTEELVDQVESSDFVEAKRTQFDEFVPPIDFSTAINFAKFGSAELYYEKAFERIHNYYPYDGTLHEKIEFENSSSYLDKYVLSNLYPRTNGYLNFNSSSYISVQGGPHTASAGMTGKALESTFDLSMKFDEEKKRTSAFEYRGSDGITAEFWFKKPAGISGQKTVFHVTGVVGDIEVKDNSGNLMLVVNSGSVQISDTFATITDADWNYYAVTLLSSSTGLTTKGYKNGQIVTQLTSSKNIPDLLPTTDCLNMRVGRRFDNDRALTGSLDEFRFWKTARTPEDIFNTWFIPVGGGTNNYDSNINLSCYFKFNEGITGNTALDLQVLDYSGRINNGEIINFATTLRETGSAITEKLAEPEFLDPVIYSSHPDVIAKKAEYKTSGSLADLESTSMFNSYFPGWMQEEDEQNGKQLKYLSQVLGSYFDTLWHQINFINRVHDGHYISGSNKALPFAKKLLYDEGFVIPDLFVDATKIERLRQKDDNEVFEKEINEVRNTIYHNIYNNLNGIYKTKGTEKSFRNLFRSLGIGQDVVKLKMYADDSTFVLRDNYEYKSYERKFVDFNVIGHSSASIYQTTSSTNTNIYIPGDTNFTGSFTLETEVILPRKQRSNEPNHNPFPYLSSSLIGYHSGQSYTHPAADYGLQVYVVHSTLENGLDPSDEQRVKFVLTGSILNASLETDYYWGQYENNKWSLSVRLKDLSYPRPNVTGSLANNYLLEFYGVEADGDTERNSFLLSTASVNHQFFSSDKIFYAGAHKTNFTGSTLQYSDVKLGYLRYWHSYLSNDAIRQHAYDSETFGANEPFEQDLFDVYPVEIPREKTLSFHWAFNNLTSSDSGGNFTVPDLSSGSAASNYGPLSNTIERFIAAYGYSFTPSSSKALDKNYLYSARKKLPDDLMSSDLTTIKSEETEQFFVDEDVSDNFYSFEKSMWGSISDEMMNMFSTALDMNNLIGQSNQKYHHKYGMAEFLRDRFFDDVENEPDIEKFTSFYKWIDDSISIALQQLTPASARFSEKINNVIESHVLERNKYVHQIPILTNFESTEGSIKGISEMKYNWKFGHAPTDIDNEDNNCLWQRDRKQKEGFRENIRNSRNNYSIQSSGLLRREIGGNTVISDTYAVRRFAKTYDVSMVTQNTLHGGTNFGRRKNLELFRESILPAGELGATSGVPQNVIVVGVGKGYGIPPEQVCNDDAPIKKKINVEANLGKYTGDEYKHQVFGDFVLPMNVMTGTISTGFNSIVSSSYKKDVYFTNLHNDIIGNTSDIPMQGPFTENHVGGLQYRHIDINQYDSTTGRVNSAEDRPEGWGLVVGVHPITAPDSDGAFGFVPADYEDPYPSATAQKATRYRDETAKRPVNIRNIKTLSGSKTAGNYKNELDIFQVSPTFQKTWAIEAYSDPSVKILPTFISSALPLTTHYQTLMGYVGHVTGNVFGTMGNNRQSNGGIIIPAIPGTPADGTFVVTGSPNPIITASGSFDILGTEVEGTFATGSFEVTGNIVSGVNATGQFTMSGAFAPAVSASYTFLSEGKTTLAVASSASFAVSGAIVTAAPATASFDVSGIPVGGSKAYNFFDASYQMASDEHVTILGRNGDTNGVEIDWTGAGTAGNTLVSPVIFQSSSNVTGSGEYYYGAATYTSQTQFVLNFWIQAEDGATDITKPKYLYQTYDGTNSTPQFEVFFSGSEYALTGSEARRLIIRQYAKDGGSFNGDFHQWHYDGLASGGGYNWTMLTFFRHGTGGELAMYLNATGVVAGASPGQLVKDFTPSAVNWSGVAANSHYVMGDRNATSEWNANAKISDFIMWNSNVGTTALRADFAKYVYNHGVLEPSIPSGSDVGWRYTFGDGPNDQIRSGIHSIYDITTSGSNLTASYTDTFTDSLFVKKRTSSEYFAHLKSALLSHNSDNSYFGVEYEEYTEIASGSLNSLFYYQEEGQGFKPGTQTDTHRYVIASGSTLNKARFFVHASAESAAGNYTINPSVDNDAMVGQARSFIHITSNNTGSAQENALAKIENTGITINGDTIRFNDHNNGLPGNKVATFTTTASCIQGSSTTNSANFVNGSYPAASTLYGSQVFSFSFWKSHASAGTNETVLQLGTATNSSAVLIFTDDNGIHLLLSDSSRNTRTWHKNFNDIDVAETDMQHYVWAYDDVVGYPQLYVNAISQSNVISTDSGFGNYDDTAITQINVAGNSQNTTDELRGKLSQLSIWSGSLNSTIVSQIYNDGRPKDLYELPYNSSMRLAHWYKLSDEVAALGSNLSSVSTILDKSQQIHTTDLTVNSGGDFTVASGIPTNTIANSTFWTALNSSIDSNVTDYTADNTNGDFTVSFTSTGPAGNGDALSTTSVMISNLETPTSGGINQSGAVDGDSLTIGTINFIADDDGTSDGGSNRYIQFTGSNSSIWNALSQSIKDNSVFGTIRVDISGDIATFHLTSSTSGAANNVAMSESGTGFEVLQIPAGGLNHTGAVDEDFIKLRPTAASSADRVFAVDTTGTKVNNTPSGYRYVNPVVASNTLWWNAITASIAAEGYAVSYTADSPSAGTASFVVTSYIAAAAGNNGQDTQFSGSTFTNIGSLTFASGSDASGSIAGDTITVDGTTYTLAAGATGSSVQVSVTGSSEVMFEDLRSKIQAQTGFNAVTASSGIPRTFTLTSKATGSSEDPNISESGNTFTFVSETAGKTESGAENGDTITIDGYTYRVATAASASNSEFHNILSQSIKDETAFDTITITDLGTGYFRYQLTASVTGSAKNNTIVQNSNGSRTTFQNLLGTAGGTDETGAEAGDTITIDGQTFTIVDGAPGDTQDISTTGSTSLFHGAMSDSIKRHTNFDTIAITSLGSYSRFSLTSSEVGAAGNATFTSNSSGARPTFANLESAANGKDASGIVDQASIEIGTFEFILTSSAPADSGSTFYVQTDTSSSSIWATLETKIEGRGYSVTVTDSGPTALFELTSSATGSAQNVAMSGSSPTFTSVQAALANGTDITPAVVSLIDNVIATPRTDLTGSQRNINTRFSAPGGPEIQTISYLDAYTQTYSVHNGMPFRNLTVLGSGSGEEGTIRVEDHLGRRRGLRTLRALHMGKFGIDATFGQVTSPNYPSSGSFNKQHRNNSQRIENGPVVDIGTATQASGSFEMNASGFSTPQSFAGGVFAITSGDGTAKNFIYKNGGGFSSGDLDGSNVVIQVNGETFSTVGGEVETAIQSANGHQGRMTATSVGEGGKSTITVTELAEIGTAGNNAKIATIGSFGLKFAFVSPTADGVAFNNGAAAVTNYQQTLITGSNHDNAFINTPIPRSELQYSWIHNATSGSANTTYGAPAQRIYGYAPRDGIISSSAGYVEAIVFPTASSIFGS